MFNPIKVRKTTKKMVECPIKNKLCLVSDCTNCANLDQASSYMNRVKCEVIVLDDRGALKKIMIYNLPMIDPTNVG
jgi:hypothetical protein